MTACELRSGELAACLSGPDRLAGVRGMYRRPPEPRPDGQPSAIETLDLALEGAGAVPACSQVEAVLARVQAGLAGEIVLQEPGGTAYCSPLLEGWSERIGPPSLPDSSRGLRLTLRRAPFWEGDPLALALRNPYGETAAGLRVDCRADLPLSANWALVSQPAGLSPLPAPLRLEVLNDQPGAKAIGPLWVCAAGRQPPFSSAHLLEGESGWPGPGVTATLVTDAGCLDGAYRRLSWSLAGPRLLNGWSFSGHLQQNYAGLPARLALRLASPSGGDLWLQARLTASDGALLAAGEPSLLPAGQTLAVLPPVSVPTGLASGAYVENLELWAEAPALPASLPLDAAYLLPAEDIRALQPLAAGCPPGWTLVDDPLDGLYSLDPANSMRGQTHAGQGACLPGWAGEQRKLFLLWGQPDGASDITQRARLRAVIRPRVADV